MDGQAQRRALAAAEKAIRSLGAGDVEAAQRAAVSAAELDQIGAFAGLDVAVTNGDWDAVAAVVAGGPLEALVTSVR